MKNKVVIVNLEHQKQWIAQNNNTHKSPFTQRGNLTYSDIGHIHYGSKVMVHF